MPTRSKVHGQVDRKLSQRAYDRSRGPDRQYYSTRNWRALREAFLRANPLCYQCQRENRLASATVVHHIKARHEGGTDDWSNLEPVCVRCHNRITALETNFGRPPGRQGVPPRLEKLGGGL